MQDFKVCEKIMKTKGQLYKALIETLSIEEIKDLISGVEIVSKSPYSDSFYSSNDISWNHKPDGSYRISDHWNFWSYGKYHCETASDVASNSWSLGVYNAELGKYEILKSYPKQDRNLDTLREQRRSAREVKSTYRQNRISELYEKILNERAAVERAKKIENGAKRRKGTKIWVEINVNKWTGSGRNVRYAGTETLVGYLTWESKSGNSFCIRVNGMDREIRKCNSYKELSRKPAEKKFRAAA